MAMSIRLNLSILVVGAFNRRGKTTAALSVSLERNWSAKLASRRYRDLDKVSFVALGVARGAKPVLRIEIRIEGRSNPSVRFDGSLLTVSDDLGHLRAYELTHGEQIRDLNL